MSNIVESYISGVWKFDITKITIEQVNKIAEEWSKNSAYIFLGTRGTGRREVGIEFVYSYNGTEQEYLAYSNTIKNTYENVLKGWDIDGKTKIIKLENSISS